MMVEKTNEGEVNNVLDKSIQKTDLSTKKCEDLHFQYSSNKKHLSVNLNVPDDGKSPTDSENRFKDTINEIYARAKIMTSKESCRPTGNKSGSSRSNKEPGCGIYYGIKSYLHQFYGPPDKEVLKSGEYLQADDFHFISEPHRRQNCCVRVGLWVGINLVLLGGIAVLVGYFTPPRPTIVGQFQEFTIFDRLAVNFNYHLMVCQLVGLVTFSLGAVIIIFSLAFASCQPSPPPPAYLVMGTYFPPTTVDRQPHTSPTWGIHCIPLSGTVKSVQPNIY